MSGDDKVVQDRLIENANRFLPTITFCDKGWPVGVTVNYYHRDLRRYAGRRGVSVQTLIRQIVAEWVDAQEG